ncbi:MAG TPA: hypothetical protein VGQ73_04325, partial [Gemmatimonadales bacterium]|nr:hypothetical protein [Gemmatimonadales bacterium]
GVVEARNKVGAKARTESAGVRPAPSPPAAVVTVPPALFDLEAAGRYLGGLSAWTIRDYIEAGLLRPVPLPSPSGKPLRRIVLAREDLDALVARWRGRP